MRCTVTGRPYTIFGYGGKQVRDNIHSADVVQAFWLFHQSPRPAAVYNLGGGRASNVSMLEAIAKCERIAGRELRLRRCPTSARIGDHRWWISDLGEFAARLPAASSSSYGIDEVLQEIHEDNVEHWSEGPRRDEALGRHPGPQRGGLDRADRGRRSSTRSSASGSTTRSSSSTTTRRTAPASSSRRSPSDGRPCAASRNDGPAGFGFAVRAGLDAFARRRRRDHDGRPLRLAAGPRHLLPPARAGLRLRLRLALHARRRRTDDYPRFKLLLNRLVNLGIRLLFRHGYNDTTNAFKAYRREVIESVQPLLSNHFNLTVELPLKAIVRGSHLRRSCRSRGATATPGESKLRLQEMGSRYLFIVLYVFLEHHLSRGDYRRRGGARWCPAAALAPRRGARAHAALDITSSRARARGSCAASAAHHDGGQAARDRLR